MELLRQLFASWAGEPCEECLALGVDGSSPRRYYRLRGHTRQCIGTVATDRRENEAFFAFTHHFRKHGIRVPDLYLVHDDRQHYLQQDLGDQTLYGLLREKKRHGQGFDAEMLSLYRQVLTDLAAIQQAGCDMDYSIAYPHPAFDRRSILWDLNYFKYCFLKNAHIDFDEERLENDINRLADILLDADQDYFLYRDFQGRNIMVVQIGGRNSEVGTVVDNLVESTSDLRPPTSNLYYIDYQGGRRGAAQYDVASLLYSAKSDLPEAIRTELLNHYLKVRAFTKEERGQWLHHFWYYVLIRILQTLGAYGYRGLYERKPYFLESIPLAITNLRRLTEDHPDMLKELPEIGRIVDGVNSEIGGRRAEPSDLKPPTSDLTLLTVDVQSFSYKQGLPVDSSGNGGGHIFDCRALPNPGRYPEYQHLTGSDGPVVDFLRAEAAVDEFLHHAQAIVGQSVDKYLERRFTHLSVAFGCTGGQHRSVYCANRLAEWLQSTYPQIVVNLCHREQAPRT